MPGQSLLIKLSDLVQGHLPSDLLSAGWPTGHARAAQRSMMGPASSRLECGLAAQMQFIVAFSDGALGRSLFVLLWFNRTRGGIGLHFESPKSPKGIGGVNSHNRNVFHMKVLRRVGYSVFFTDEYLLAKMWALGLGGVSNYITII